MKLLLIVVAVCVAARSVSGAALSPRDEAAELLLETAQLDAKMQDKRELAANKRSYSPSYGNGGTVSYGGGNGGYGGYEPNFEYQEPHVPAYPVKAPTPGFDLWGFKRAILSALYQAVRAVAGGSIAVKGQIIKGGGNLISTQGKLIASGGQAVSEIGRNIAHSSLHSAPVVPTYHHTVSAPAYTNYGSGYSSYHNEGPGVLETIGKAKIAVSSAVGNAVGNVVAGAAGAVGSAVAGAAGAVAGVVSGAADAVSHHVSAKLNPPKVQHHNYVPQAVAYKPSVQLKQPIYVVEQPQQHQVHAAAHSPVDHAATYGGSLDESFGTPVFAAGHGYNGQGYSGQGYNGQQAYGAPEYSIQPSISYDLQ